jgi:hypothetical protein
MRPQKPEPTAAFPLPSSHYLRNRSSAYPGRYNKNRVVKPVRIELHAAYFSPGFPMRFFRCRLHNRNTVKPYSYTVF